MSKGTEYQMYKDCRDVLGEFLTAAFAEKVHTLQCMGYDGLTVQLIMLEMLRAYSEEFNNPDGIGVHYETETTP